MAKENEQLIQTLVRVGTEMQLTDKLVEIMGKDEKGKGDKLSADEGPSLAQVVVEVKDAEPRSGLL